MQTNIKFVLFSLVFITMAPAIAMEKQRSAHLMAVDACNNRQQSPSSPQESYTADSLTPKRNGSPFAKRVHKKEAKLSEKKWCHDCIIQSIRRKDYFKENNIDGCPNPICGLKKLIDDILNLHLGFDYGFLQWTTWDLGKIIYERPTLLDDFGLKSYGDPSERLEAIKRGTPEMIKKFISLCCAHHWWLRMGHKERFTFSYNEKQEPFYVL